ncbi:MAG TPA: hypothetical protein VFV66_22020 [Nonomuraea sp.]|nr:hypothetical protein [Nonomuraea sp.]
MNNSALAAIDAFVGDGHNVMSVDDEYLIPIIEKAIESGKSASFYLPQYQADAVNEWYWTPDWVEATGLEEVSREERARIASELGIEDIGPFCSNRIQCGCGQTYGAFEFLQQGIREHGPEVVRGIFGLRNSALLHVNPPHVPVCPNCDRRLEGGGDEVLVAGGHYYGKGKYAGCCRPKII